MSLALRTTSADNTTDIAPDAVVPAHRSADSLTVAEMDAIGAELDAMRVEVMNDLGADDAAYIRRVIKVQRSLELTSRAILLFSGFPPAWIAGTAGLAIAKILENMEIGHNVLHGQWDWMRDPKIHSTTWEWDHVTPAKHWKQSHNDSHHTWTNVLGKDDDLGYGVLRVDPAQPWTLGTLGQPAVAVGNALAFEYGIGAYDAKLGPYLRGEVDRETFEPRLKAWMDKVRKQAAKDYLVHPLLSGPAFVPTLAANVVANVIRNVWSNAIIMCGHFPSGVQTFSEESLEGETRGRWYVRQMLGSANITGSKLMHIMSGNLSHQIEHHIFPDMPSNRYAQVAPRVKAIFERYGLHYEAGSLPRQLGSVWAKFFRLSLPNPEPGRSRGRIVLDAVADAAGGLGARMREKVRGLRAPQARAALAMG
ncbi:fatty acid desaturase family protein [Granulicoccus sp. GXG6511]|uniref:fatty acid desaturase family protein n=1 Tax=Granulicoccus sp. GXG6511 TaxID=3381351 RepID=UPI003D7CAEB0